MPASVSRRTREINQLMRVYLVTTSGMSVSTAAFHSCFERALGFGCSQWSAAVGIPLSAYTAPQLLNRLQVNVKAIQNDTPANTASCAFAEHALGP